MDEWSDFSLGQTTALGGGRSPELHNPTVRNQFYRFFTVDSVHEAQQTHGDGLRTTGPYSTCYLDTDGLFCSSTRDMLTMRTADCFPVFIKNSTGRRFGLIHAGWRGLNQLIVRKSLNRWFQDPVDLIIGSGIAPDDYEVGSEVVEALSESHDLPVSQLRRRGLLDDEDNVNLPGLVRLQAETSSPEITNITHLPPNTCQGDRTPRMLSYRRNQTEDRMVSWIFRLS